MNQESANNLGALDRRCQEPNCSKLATPNSNRRREDRDRRRWRRTQNTRNVRRLLRRRSDVNEARLRIVPFTQVLDIFPDSPGARKYFIWDQLGQLDRLLFEEGPATYEIRKKIRQSADLVRLQFLREKPRNADEVHQYFHSMKILLDVGVDDLRQLPLLLRYSAELLAFHLRTAGDVCGLVTAILDHANALRLHGWENKGKRLVRYALHILEELPDDGDPRKAVLHHNALFHYLRFFGTFWDPDQQNAMMREIEDRAHDIRTPGVWLETLREEVRHWGAQGKRDTALKYAATLEEWQKKHSFPAYGVQCLLRPKIHALLATKDFKDRDEAVHLVEQYRTLYLTDRHCYYFTQLRRWRRELKLGYDVPPPTYGSMIFTYLPRYEV